MADKRRRKFTQEQTFERWWAKHRPSNHTLRYEGMTDLHLEIMRQWASMAFYRGCKRERERSQ